ncbi:MAG: DUF4268 domain-containing protein [Chloroflexi bacterium]|nr:DUF4268 domain-containing protein [Chloroflexota bacterium]
MPDFGVLKKIDLREVWSKEASQFTPWLADNLDALGAALGMELQLETREAACGDFSCDLLARDLGTNRIVVIENQLESTDHDHLGKLITYASGLDAGVVVWIAPEVREEHRQALDWLNQRTDATVDFFAAIVEVLKIDDSRPAFSLRPVAFPNQWRKDNVARSAAGKPSERGEAYRAFFQDLIDELRERHKFTNARAGQPQNWYNFASGISGVTYGCSFAQGGQVRAEVYIDTQEAEHNKALFDALEKDKATIEAQLGEPLKWERLNHRRACRIAAYRAGAIGEPETLTEIRTWAVQRLLTLKKVFGPKIAELSREM